MTTSKNSRWVAVRVGQALVGITLDRVEEVARLKGVTRVQPAPPAVHGIANLRGNLITLVDLDRLLHGRSIGDPCRAINVIVNTGSESIGLVAQELVGVLDMAGRTEQAVPRQVAGGNDGLVRAIVQLDEELLMLLDLDVALQASVA